MTQIDTSPATFGGAVSEMPLGFFARNGLAAFYLLLAVLVVLWGVAVYTWGPVALTVPALVMVPVVYAVLITITVGK
ncbi:hypothetical protein VK792_07105 [Mesobacterium sp. TK19101]|uniref:Uncharacterized protein n=1 Tax=Mesobacterium hydrothermale TaxID=3111907 RepID=A0ABU6HF06_9RHOB|nr:hypothetical protein [Mesobacterium sp. TK19101]MEC3861049.1 hypothetical protein [Mesobacterium sp. TK19101]